MTLRIALILASLTLLTTPTAAQSTCTLPVSAYVADSTGSALVGTVDVELRFYTDDTPGALASECRSFPDSLVEDGWLRLTVDACDAPPIGDCGAVPINALLDDGSLALWVGISVSGTELEPLLPIGAVPFAVRAVAAGDSDALQGHGPDSFESSGSIATHAAEPDAHHSSTSDGIEITPSAVIVGDSRLGDGSLDLGADVDDTLTAEMVRTLTGGGEADTLHVHASGDAGGGGCYVAWGIETCTEGYALAYSGIFLESVSIWSSGVAANPLCVADDGVETIDETGLGLSRFLMTAGAGFNELATMSDERLRCALCCP